MVSKMAVFLLLCRWWGRGRGQGRRRCLISCLWITTLRSFNIWGFLPHSAFCPKDAVYFLSPVWKRGLPWVAQARTRQALKGKGFQKHQNSKEKRVGAITLERYFL